jgi:hypothetical protein
MGITRRELRRSVARMLNDYHRATASTEGETGQITDLVFLARETDYFMGMEVIFTDEESPSYLHRATVTRSDGPNRTIYFEPPVPTSIEVGDTVDLYNFRGRGSTHDQYNAHINDAIRIARESHALVPLVVVGDTTYDRNVRTLDIPAELISIAYITFTDYSGRVRRIPPSSMRVDRLTGQVTFSSSAYTWHGYEPTFVGYGLQDLLDQDDDVCNIEPEWLFNEVKAQILERNVASGMPIGSQDRLFLQERTEAGGKRPMVITRALPNTVRIR